MNKVLLVGRVASDVVTQSMPGQTVVRTFDMATNEKEKTDFHSIISYGKVADIVSFLRKGDPVFIEGKIQTRFWYDKQNEKRRELEIVAWTVFPLKGRDETVADDAARS